jgi:hypothetical protein
MGWGLEPYAATGGWADRVGMEGGYADRRARFTVVAGIILRGIRMILVQALVTALLSGLFSGAIMFALNERRDRRAQTLEKVEQLIEAYTEWTGHVGRWLMNHYDMFSQDDRESARKELDRIWLEAQTSYNKARLLQKIYLPAKDESFRDVLMCCETLVGVSRELKLGRRLITQHTRCGHI